MLVIMLREPRQAVRRRCFRQKRDGARNEQHAHFRDRQRSRSRRRSPDSTTHPVAESRRVVARKKRRNFRSCCSRISWLESPAETEN